jgi:hypothetical protein
MGAKKPTTSPSSASRHGDATHQQDEEPSGLPLTFWSGGAKGSRTPDLVIANDALYQLSYDPMKFIINE